VGTSEHLLLDQVLPAFLSFKSEEVLVLPSTRNFESTSIMEREELNRIFAFSFIYSMLSF
jgi:hypothetical protein